MKEIIKNSLVGFVLALLAVGSLMAWALHQAEEVLETTSPSECLINPVLFEIAGETILVPESVVNKSDETILVRTVVKMKVEPWREGYYKLKNAPVGAWVVDTNYRKEE
jgi:hypothetical protein